MVKSLTQIGSFKGISLFRFEVWESPIFLGSRGTFLRQVLISQNSEYFALFRPPFAKPHKQILGRYFSATIAPTRTVLPLGKRAT